MKLKLGVLVFLILQLFSVSCFHNDKTRKEIQIDSIYSRSINYSNSEFDFKDYSTQKVWDWPSGKELKKLDANFYNTFLRSENVFSKWGEYQDLYLIGIKEFGGKRNLILGQRIHNGDELNMYLLYFEPNGSIKQLVKVASQYKAQDEYIYCKSKYIGSTLTRMTIKLFAILINQTLKVRIR